MTLNDQQIVREFVRVSRLIYANERLLTKAKSALDTSYSFEDMAFIVSQSDKELTPEEKSLLMITSNVAAINNDFDETVYPQVVSVESLGETANNFVIASSNQFSEIWLNLTAMIQSLYAINKVVAQETNQVKTLAEQAVIDLSKSPTQVSSVMVLTSLPELIRLQKYSDDYLDSLDSRLSQARGRIAGSTVNIIEAVQELITNGMTDYSKKSLRTSENDLQGQKEKLNDKLVIAKESIDQSADGLITTVSVSEQNTVVGQQESIDSKNAQLAPRVPINDQTLIKVIEQLKNNFSLIELSSASCTLMFDPKLSESVLNFGIVTQKLLASLPVNSRTKDVVKGYCNLFIKGMNTANAEVRFMLETSQSIICYNELLKDIIKHISPSTQIEVV